MRREQRLQASALGLLALLIPVGVAMVSLTGVMNPDLLNRVSLPFGTLDALAAAFGWGRLLAAGLLAIPVVAARA